MFFYDSYDIVIIGGGISGLFLGYKLVDTNLNVLILDKEKEFGGRVHSIYKNGYHYYRNGYNSYRNCYNFYKN